MNITVSFKGGYADEGRLEAFSGIESAAGMARALTIVLHFASTGEVRHRYPFSDSINFFLEETEEGSFKWKFSIAFIGPLALNIASAGIYDLTKLAFSKAVGHHEVAVSDQVGQATESRPGDFDALVEAIEPALKKGHYGIGETATSIEISETESKRVLIEFDTESKRYLTQSVKTQIQEQDVSVSALNVNDGTGRVYFLDLKRTIPFILDKTANSDTMSVLSYSLNEYANNHPAPVRIRFRRIEATDGRLKRIILTGARDVTQDD